MSLADMEAPRAPPSPAVRPPPEPAYAAARWERIVPGLDRFEDSAGGPILQQMAEQIVNRFGGPEHHPLPP